MTTVHLKPHKEESLLRFHPWVFSGAIRSIQLDADYPHAQPQEGEVVQVVDSNGKVLGVGHYQIGSIAVRILAFGIGELPHDFWQERIRAAYEVRESLGLITTENNTYRLVHGEGDFLPGLIVDVYADTAVIQAHSIGMHCHRQEIAEAIIQNVSQVDKVYYKSDDTLPHKAPIQGERVGYLIGAEKADFNGDFWAKENGLDFRIDWLRGQKTGFFIDFISHRKSAAIVFAFEGILGHATIDFLSKLGRVIFSHTLKQCFNNNSVRPVRDRLSCRDNANAVLFKQSLNGICGLCAVSDPLLCLVSVDLYISGILCGIIVTDLLDETTVTGIS